MENRKNLHQLEDTVNQKPTGMRETRLTILMVPSLKLTTSEIATCTCPMRASDSEPTQHSRQFQDWSSQSRVSGRVYSSFDLERKTLRSRCSAGDHACHPCRSLRGTLPFRSGRLGRRCPYPTPFKHRPESASVWYRPSQLQPITILESFDVLLPATYQRAN
eukprot:2874510-Rhodomonas_salina.2